jgi:hypothetical protein
MRVCDEAVRRLRCALEDRGQLRSADTDEFNEDRVTVGAELRDPDAQRKHLGTDEGGRRTRRHAPGRSRRLYRCASFQGRADPLEAPGRDVTRRLRTGQDRPHEVVGQRLQEGTLPVRETEERTKKVWSQVLALVAFGDASVKAWAVFAADPDAALISGLVESEREHQRALFDLLEYFVAAGEAEAFETTLKLFAIRRRVLGEALAWRAERFAKSHDDDARPTRN